MRTRHYIIKITFSDDSFGYLDVNCKADTNIDNAYVYTHNYAIEGPCPDDRLQGVLDAYDSYAGVSVDVEILDIEVKLKNN